ncbi:MAG: transposase [Lachnospiraceae bacterium]|nr:transposase [Lachnospiraceae bacterium]
MSIVSQNHTNEVVLLDCIQRFFSKHRVGTLLKKCNGTKEKGVPAISLLKYKLGNVFAGRSMYMQQRTGSFKESFSKNTFYRFLNSVKTNWLKFTSLLAADIINNDIKPLTDDNRADVFIIDDSLFNRSSCKKTELGSRVFDHVDMKYKKGFRMLTLSWSDGNTLIPVNSCLVASSKESNVIGPVSHFDKRTIAGQRRILAQTKAPEAMTKLLNSAISAGISAKYVLFDCWYANPAQITGIKTMGMDVIAMIKKSSKIKYGYNGEQLNIKQIYAKNKKRRGRSKYLLSVDVMLGKGNPIPAKIVCVKNKANRKDWLAFICTDTSLSEEEIIRIYGKRWQIEVFFKTCKSSLNLIDECHSLSYDALTAHTAIVFTRYMLLAMEQRQNEDLRTLGELFFFLVDEMADITFIRSLTILFEAMLASLQEMLRLSDQQLDTFVEDFESRLPQYLRDALHPERLAA